MAPSRKKHAREVRRDKFREKTLEQFDRVGDRLEGKGRTLLYVLSALQARKIPTVVLTSGGYTSLSYQAIASTILTATEMSTARS